MLRAPREPPGQELGGQAERWGGPAYRSSSLSERWEPTEEVGPSSLGGDEARSGMGTLYTLSSHPVLLSPS